MSSQQIFFSYSRADSAFALTLAKDLREVGADIWIDQLDIPAGSHWDAAVEKALNNAAYVLVILTPSSTASTNVMDEVSFALESGKKIVPVLQEDCLPPFRLRRLQRIDFTIDYNTGFNQLIQSLNLSLKNIAHNKGLDFNDILIDTSSPVDPETKEAGKEARDNALWLDACKLNTIASYNTYLSESPFGTFVEEARLMIRQLELEQKEDEIEALLWQKTKSGNTKLLYQHYLETYPQGNYKTLAVGAIAELDKLEKAAKDKQLQLEKEKAQKEQEERDRQLQIEKEKERKEQEDRNRQLQIEKEKAEKEKEEKEKQLQLEKEKERKAKEEREKQAQKEKEEREKQIALANAKAKAERDKQLQLEKEKAQQEKIEREKQAQIAKAKAQKEKEERERQKREANEAAAIAKKAEKEKARLARMASGEPPPNNKKYIYIGAGVLALCLVIWWVSSLGDGGDRKAWNAALDVNDSIAFAGYVTAFPEGKYVEKAKENINLLYWEQRKIQDSLAQIASAQTPAATNESSSPTASSEVVSTSVNPETKPDPEKTKTSSSVSKPKTPTTAKPKTPPVSTQKSAPSKNSKLSLGMEYGGGIIIYVNPDGTHGMIVSSKEVTDITWDKAQKVIAAYKEGSYTGWTMPSKNELNIIYQNRKYLGNHAGETYWSSTEENKNSAWTQNFSTGNQAKTNKQSTAAMRAVRPF